MHLTGFKKDARYFQISFQTLFLCYGLIYLHWTAEWVLYATYFGSGLAAQFFSELIFKKSRTKKLSVEWFNQFKTGIPSVIISSFGLILLLKTNEFTVAILASIVAILSKYIIRINGKHIFNPSALGIVVAVYLSGEAWINPGQWGSNIVILFGVMCLGFIVTTRVQKLDLSLAFIGTFGALLFVRQILYLGWPMDYFIQSISTGSLLIFTFFMITDPKTTPNHWLARIIWSIAIAVVSFYLATFQFMVGAPILVLVLAQPLVPILDKLFMAKKFEWSTEKVIHQSETQILKTIRYKSFI